jgi:plastocyanin
MRVVSMLLALLLASPAAAADLSVTVRTAAGKPESDAVITVYPVAGVPNEPIRFSWPMRMEQRNLTFSPFVLIAPAGANVAFPNKDAVRHNVYSFSPAHPFELKLYSADETRSVRFDKVGVVALGCNIHDFMLAFIKVVDTPYAAKTDASGVVELHGLPAGGATLHVWHPFMKTPNNEMTRPITLAAAAPLRLALSAEFRSPPDRRTAY